MKYLLDTNVFREVGKTEPHRHVRAWVGRVDDADLAISTLTVREVSKGIVKLREIRPEVAAAIRTRVAAVYAAFDDRVLPVTREIAELWGQLLAVRDKHVEDTGLAATARVHGLVLVTRNLTHLAGRGIATLDPFSASPIMQ